MYIDVRCRNNECTVNIVTWMYVIFSVGPYRLVYARKVTYVNSRQGHVRDTYFVVYCKATFSHAIFPPLRPLSKTVHFKFSYPTSIAYIKPPLKRDHFLIFEPQLGCKTLKSKNESWRNPMTVCMIMYYHSTTTE